MDPSRDGMGHRHRRASGRSRQETPMNPRPTRRQPRTFHGSHTPATVLRLALVATLTLAGAVMVGLSGAAPAQALANGLATTPAMGWNDWNSYGCGVSESLVKQTA